MSVIDWSLLDFSKQIALYMMNSVFIWLWILLPLELPLEFCKQIALYMLGATFIPST